eukprot:6214438-Alexandrium_andersonii.AAC.1
MGEYEQPVTGMRAGATGTPATGAPSGQPETRALHQSCSGTRSRSSDSSGCCLAVLRPSVAPSGGSELPASSRASDMHCKNQSGWVILWMGWLVVGVEEGRGR